MKLTLTNAHRIRKSLEAVVASKDFVRGIKNNTEFSVFEKKQTVEFIEKDITSAQNKFQKDVESALEVIDILNHLRSLIATKNREIEIGVLLDKEASIKARIRVYTEITQMRANTDSLTVIHGRLAHLINQNNDTSSHYAESELKVNIISEEILEKYKKQLTEAKREQRSVLDKITGLNSLNHIELDDKMYRIIESIGIL